MLIYRLQHNKMIFIIVIMLLDLPGSERSEQLKTANIF